MIARFEAETGRPVPTPYKEFLLRSNGADLALPIFQYRVMDRVREGGIDTLLAVNHADQFKDLGNFIRTYADQDRIPHDLYPIGVNDGDDLILMGGEGPRFGRIYYWFHELESPWDQPPTERNVFPVADSLDEFLAILKPFLRSVD